MQYELVFMPRADEDMFRLAKSEPAAYKKLKKLLDELRQHPTTGTGKPHQLHGDRAGQWSRKITDKHRLVYMIHEKEVVVLVLTAYGHYDDK